MWKILFYKLMTFFEQIYCEEIKIFYLNIYNSRDVYLYISWVSAYMG